MKNITFLLLEIITIQHACTESRQCTIIFLNNDE